MPKPFTNSVIVMQSNSGSPASEAYRSLRFNIECFNTDHTVKTLTVTSAGRGEGKSTTAINLAAAYAQIGKKVILLDADLRNPSIHLAFGRDNGRGLSSYLANQSSADEIILESYVENLSILISGPAPANPSELLASKRMDALLVELKQNYDMIIIDTPSVLTLTDAKVIAAKCDGVLLVIKYGNVKRNTAKKVKEELALAKAKLVGVVMNNMKKQDAAAYL